MLSDLRESGAIEQDADIGFVLSIVLNIIILKLMMNYAMGANTEIICEVSRWCPGTTIGLHWMDKTKFEDPGHE
jgi:hypothetical protein